LEDDGLKRFFESIINHKHIISLDLGDCKLTDNSVDCINSLIYIDDKNDWPGKKKIGLFKLHIYIYIFKRFTRIKLECK
jgi:hypothetical protein